MRDCNRGLQPASEDASPRKEQDETPHFLVDRCRRLLGAGAGLYEQYWLICAKNLGLGAVTPVIAGGLNTLREAAGDAEDKRQGVKASLREKAAETAQYVVWRHRNQEETSTQVCTKTEFCKMMATARPIMKKKLRRRGRLARWFSTPPPEELVEIYVREEIAKVLRADGVTLEDGECCPPWTKAAWAKSPQAAVPAETSEDDKTPARRKLIKRVLPVAVASTALGVAAFK